MDEAILHERAGRRDRRVLGEEYNPGDGKRKLAIARNRVQLGVALFLNSN